MSTPDIVIAMMNAYEVYSENADGLVIGFDQGKNDFSALIVGRKDIDGKIQIVNQFQGCEAEELYNKLTKKSERVTTVLEKESGSDQFRSPGFRPNPTQIFSRKGHSMIPENNPRI